MSNKLKKKQEKNNTILIKCHYIRFSRSDHQKSMLQEKRTITLCVRYTFKFIWNLPKYLKFISIKWVTPQFKKQTGIETRMKKEKGTQQQINQKCNYAKVLKKCELYFDIVFCFLVSGRDFFRIWCCFCFKRMEMSMGRASEGNTLTLNTVENLSLNLLCSVFCFFFLRCWTNAICVQIICEYFFFRVTQMEKHQQQQKKPETLIFLIFYLYVRSFVGAKSS